MKIAIFETEHFEGAYPVIKLFDKPGNHLLLITDTITYRRFSDLLKTDTGRHQWVLLKKRNALTFFYGLYKALKKNRPDIVYINTISSRHILFAAVLSALPALRVILTIHDINCFFKSERGYTLRSIVQHAGKKMLARRINEFNVVSETMVPYLKATVQKKVLIHNIPGAVYEQESVYCPINTGMHLVIPGSIDSKRRDYNLAFALAGVAESHKLPMQITLLGGYTNKYGQDAVTKAMNWRANHVQVVSYDTDIVPQDEFDKQMNRAHFVFIPSVVHTIICGNIPEVYGLTKSSGNIFDVIKHARPFIVPRQLAVPENLQSSCFRYEMVEEIVTFLADLLATPGQYETWQQKAHNNSLYYTIDAVREKNPACFK